ncbi:tripartite tricarboxylate transporter substrate binding protein [Cupriavidus pauculus]|uniref:Bug family tripartite tricarboxylate transporter substrate binding protein n=1 Tax=Cupriavidus pauculus TaxID=82633 RepID=UPI001EE268A6|nr:tripartite tricarboxylate transporter substrate binding protein [Cupriavidus pauculus]GJG96689.1 tripartite tricarboxylate transporter substrate binding protein [Cupriavidus pauculus]
MHEFRYRGAIRACAGMTLAASVCLGSTALAADTTTAATYPDKVVKIVMPFPPGGMGDTLARLLANQLAKEWKQTVIVENRPGASGMIGNEYVARAHPDGYTLLLTITQVVQAPALYNSLPYDIGKDFTPLSKVANALSVFVAPPASDVKSLKDYVRLAGASPGKYSYGSYGAGTTSHIYAEIFNRRNNLTVTHVPYKGAAPLINDMIGGHVGVSFVDLSTALPFVKAGKLNAYAVVSAKRSAALPNVPTFAELGYQGMSVVGWYGLFGPAKIPPEIAAKISRSVEQAVNTPEMQKQIAQLGLEPIGTDGTTFARIIRDDTATWSGIIKEGGVHLD